MPLLSVAGLVAQGKLTRVPLPEGEALRSAVAGSMQQHAMELAGQLSPVFDAIADTPRQKSGGGRKSSTANDRART